MNNKKAKEVVEQWEGKVFSDFKKELSSLLVEKICPIGKEIKKLKLNKDFLKQVLEDGKNKANVVANKNLKEIKEIVGLSK